MLKKRHKIKRALFPSIVSKGKTVHSPYITLRILERKETQKDSVPLFSFVVSSKVAPKAVRRNLLKRRGYAIIKKMLNSGRIAPEYVYAFFFKKGSDSLSFTKLEKEIILLLQKSNTLRM